MQDLSHLCTQISTQSSAQAEAASFSSLAETCKGNASPPLKKKSIPSQVTNCHYRMVPFLERLCLWTAGKTNTTNHWNASFSQTWEICGLWVIAFKYVFKKKNAVTPAWVELCVHFRAPVSTLKHSEVASLQFLKEMWFPAFRKLLDAPLPPHAKSWDNNRRPYKAVVRISITQGVMEAQAKHS